MDQVGEFVQNHSQTIRQEWSIISALMKGNMRQDKFRQLVDNRLVDFEASMLRYLAQAIMQYKLFPDIEEFMDTLTMMMADDPQTAPKTASPVRKKGGDDGEDDKKKSPFKPNIPQSSNNSDYLNRGIQASTQSTAAERNKEELWKIPVYDDDLRIQSRKDKLNQFKHQIQQASAYCPPLEDTSKERIARAIGVPVERLFPQSHSTIGYATTTNDGSGLGGYATSVVPEKDPVTQKLQQALFKARSAQAASFIQSQRKLHSDLERVGVPQPSTSSGSFGSNVTTASVFDGSFALPESVPIANDKNSALQSFMGLKRYAGSTKHRHQDVGIPPDATEQSNGSQLFSVAPWSIIGNLIVRHEKLGSTINPTNKIIGFDMDQTLIDVASGAKFPKNESDWKWHFENVATKIKQAISDGYRVIIISNQAGISTGNQDAVALTKKVNQLALHFGETTAPDQSVSSPIFAVLAIAKDKFRKPSPLLWTKVLELFNGGVKPDEAIYVGDAAGRKGDWASSDRHFAFNAGIAFQTDKEYFQGVPKESFEESDDPLLIAWKEKIQQRSIESYNIPPSNSAVDCVVLLGPPGSGKSTLFKKHFEPLGYAHLNNDTKDVSPSDAINLLRQKKSVVIDNTNPSESVRIAWIKAAKSVGGVSIRCIFVNTPIPIAQHLNIIRSWTTTTSIVPEIAYHVYNKRFKAPSKSEGFHEIIELSMNGLPDNQDDIAKFLWKTSK